jgi:hypothetical protein
MKLQDWGQNAVALLAEQKRLAQHIRHACCASDPWPCCQLQWHMTRSEGASLVCWETRAGLQDKSVPVIHSCCLAS